MKFFSRVALAASVAIAALPSLGQAQVWTNWTSGTGPGGTVTGSLDVLGVNLSGGFAGYQLNDGTVTPNSFVPYYSAGRVDLDFFSPSAAFTQGGLNAPPPRGLIQFINTATITITFTGGVVIDPFFAINSLGNPTNADPTSMTFGPTGAAAALLSSNDNGVDAYWGTGKCTLTGNTLFGSECSGVVRLTGTYSSITVTANQPENWYGFTVGALRTQSVVPEPSTYVLMAVGLVGLGLAARRRRAA